MTAMTDDECRAAWAAGFAQQPPILYRYISGTQLSIVRHGVGAVINDRQYTYISATDELIRDDVLAWLTKRRKAEKAEQAQSMPKQVQGQLL
jgi:hypothetical protein